MAEVFGTVASAIVVAGELQRLVKKIRHYRSKAGRLPTKFFDRVSKYILEHELKDLHLLLLDDMDKVVERALFAVSGLLSTLSQRSEGMRSWQGLELKHRLVSFIRRKGLGTLRDRSEGKGCFEPWVLTQEMDQIWDDYLNWVQVEVSLLVEVLAAEILRLFTLFMSISLSRLCFKSYYRFFNGVRYKCTTMPWTIWPALVVLWGVCWMFYGSPAPEYASLYPGINALSHLELTETFLSDGDDTGFPWPDISTSGIEIQHPIFLTDVSTLVGSPTTMEYSILPRYVTDDPSMRPTAFLLDHNAQPTESDVPQAQLPSSFNPNPTFESQSWIHEPPQVTESASADSAPRVVPPRNRNRHYPCSICNRAFDRSDSLKRHHREQHSGPSTEKFLCPHPPCKKSKKGSGFKREEQLNVHLKSCKVSQRKASQRSDVSQLEPSRLPTHQEASVGPTISYQATSGSGDVTGENVSAETVTNISYGSLDRVSELTKWREAELEEFERSRQKMERSRKIIADIDQLLNDLRSEGSSG